MHQTIRMILFRQEGNVERIVDIYEFSPMKTKRGKFITFHQRIFDEAFAGLASGQYSKIEIKEV